MRAKIDKFKENLKSHKKVTDLIEWSKHYPLPFSGGIAVFDIGQFIYEETKKDNLTTRSNSIAFSLFIAIFPFIIFLFTLLPYLPFTDTYFELINETSKSVMPTNAHDWIMGLIADITKIKREGLLSLGFLLAIYFSSDGVLTLMQGFDKSYKASFKQRSFLYKRGIALALTFMLSILFLISLFLVFLGRRLFTFFSNVISNSNLVNITYEISSWILAYIILYSGIHILYSFGPSLRKKLPYINPGNIVSSILCLITSLLFAYFVNNFGKYNELYGSIGALIVILLWLKINAFILLVGFELNASIAVNRDLENTVKNRKMQKTVN